MKTKKAIALFVTAAIAFSSLLSLAACDNTPKAPEVTGIEVTTAPTKLSYVLGESFDTTGMVVSKVLSDNTKAALGATEYTYAPNGALKLNNNKVTITYQEDEKSYTASVNITVHNEVASVEIVTEPTKKDYVAGQVFDPAGMTIKATYEDGSSDDTFAVTSEMVNYKTTGLVKSDSHFALNYGGFTFYQDITVVHGAFVEAEEGQLQGGAKIESAAPSSDAIALDYANALGNVEDAQGHRGVDEGKNCLETGIDSCYKGANGCTISGGRVDIRSYVYNHLEWTETTGGTPAKSGMIQNNHVQFNQGGKVLYRLTTDKAGKVKFIFKMANPHFEGDSSPQNSKAVETKLSEVFKLTLGGTEVNIPDSVKLAAVDWSEYKAYNKAADYAVKGNSDQYTGSLCKPIYCWQNIEVELNVQQGINDLVVESVWNHDDKTTGKQTVKLDSITCNADEDEITLSLQSEFKPVVKSAQIKTEDGKVLMGVIVDAQSVGYTDDEVKGFLALTKVESVGSASYKGNTIGGETEDGTPIVAGDDKNDPWTQPTDRGGLGYTAAPPMVNFEGSNSGPKFDYKSKMGGAGNADSVEKITEGAYAGYYVVWFDVTISAENSDNYVGVWTFSQFNYGTAYTNSKPDRNILKTDENVTAELGGYCYQVYCDTRDQWNSFGWQNLCLVVQKGSFEGDNACAKLMRRYMGHTTDNDQELIDLRA